VPSWRLQILLGVRLQILLVGLIGVILIAACDRGGGRGSARPPGEPAPLVRRAVYVRDLGGLLANDAERSRLDRLVRERRVTDVIPYGMGPLLATDGGRATLAAWIDEVHRGGGRVVAPVAGADRLDGLVRLRADHASAALDGLITEHEFWNRPDRAAALDELLALLAAMRRVAPALGPGGRGIPIGAYLGYPTAAEAAELAAAVDFVFLDYSVRSPAGAWRHVHARGGALRRRFGWFAAAGVAVWPIFYAAGEVDMRRALVAGGVGEAERRFQADLAGDAEQAGRRVAGFAYFTVEALPEPPPIGR